MSGAAADPSAAMSPPGLVRRDDAADRRLANRAVGVSALGLFLTGLAELLIAVMTGSVALLADALHNLSDVSTSVVVFLGFRISKRQPSERYPYGYERAEDLAGIGVALVIWASAVLAGYESYRKLVSDESTSALAFGIGGAVIGIIGNQMVARYKLSVGRRINSATLIAEAKHSWLDAVSSVGAMVGLVAVAFGFRRGDPIAGFAVTLFIVHVGYEVTGEIVHHLMDGIDPSTLGAAREAALGVEGVEAVVARGRWMGRSLFLEIEGEVSPDTSVAGAETIGTAVEEAVFRAVPEAQVVSWTPRAASRETRSISPTT